MRPNSQGYGSRHIVQKPKNFVHRISFGMWLSFTLLAVGIALLFWIVLGTSLRMSYRNENLSELERVTWNAMKKYGEEDFENNLRFVASGEAYFVQIISENDDECILSLDDQGEESVIQAEGILPEDLFEKLDENHGVYQYTVEDAARNTEWAVQAIVIANIDGYRRVLIFSKSLANVDYMLRLLTTRVMFSLVIVLIIASVLSLFITRGFAGPIGRLTEKAHQLAQGDYQVTFPKGGYYELAQLSETMEMAAREFQATEELRRNFVANVSHDMKTPLTVIKMYAEMIQTVSGDNPVKREEHLERIIGETERLSAFISDSMDLAKLQSRTWDMKPDLFYLRHLIDAELEAFRIHQEMEGFIIRVDVAEDLRVYGDRKLIGRVLDNFISNAVKYSGDKKQVDIRAEKSGGKVRITVRDYGDGISKDKLPHIWERYYMVNPHGRNKTGTGLGLHIAKEIMELHQEEYGVESILGQGSSFWICLSAQEPVRSEKYVEERIRFFL